MEQTTQFRWCKWELRERLSLRDISDFLKHLRSHFLWLNDSIINDVTLTTFWNEFPPLYIYDACLATCYTKIAPWREFHAWDQRGGSGFTSQSKSSAPSFPLTEALSDRYMPTSRIIVGCRSHAAMARDRFEIVHGMVRKTGYVPTNAKGAAWSNYRSRSWSSPAMAITTSTYGNIKRTIDREYDDVVDPTSTARITVQITWRNHE